jgi:hypothetical protein
MQNIYYTILKISVIGVSIITLSGFNYRSKETDTSKKQVQNTVKTPVPPTLCTVPDKRDIKSQINYNNRIDNKRAVFITMWGDISS